MDKFTIKMHYDAVTGKSKIFISDPVTGLTIWDFDPGQDPPRFIEVKRSFWERVDYWALANLWVEPRRINWKSTKFKTISIPGGFNNRAQVIKELCLKLEKSL